MSNKPLRIREKGALIQPPPTARPARAGPLARLKATLRRPRLRRALTQAGLGLCLVGLCAAYTIGLGDNATAVVAKKRELPVYSVERDDKVLSISFDASWGADKTIAILDILDRYDVKTTFFLVGYWVDKYPARVEQIAAAGHEIGNHSNTHPHMSELGEAEIAQELTALSDKVEALTGVRPTLFRPPYGDYDDAVVLTARQNGYEPVQWSVDSLDWKNLGVQPMVKRVLDNVGPGDIVLFHNNSQYITEALPTILDALLEEGYEIVPVSELLVNGEYWIDHTGKQYAGKAGEANG